MREADECRELAGFLRQKHISEKNLKRLVELKASTSETVSRLATIVEQVARAYPFKRKRVSKLSRTHPDILRTCIEAGLLDTWLEMPDEQARLAPDVERDFEYETDACPDELSSAVEPSDVEGVPEGPPLTDDDLPF